MKRSSSTELHIGRGGAQFVQSPKGNTKGKQPTVQKGNDLRKSNGK